MLEVKAHSLTKSKFFSLNRFIPSFDDLHVFRGNQRFAININHRLDGGKRSNGVGPQVDVLVGALNRLVRRVDNLYLFSLKLHLNIAWVVDSKVLVDTSSNDLLGNGADNSDITHGVDRDLLRDFEVDLGVGERAVKINLEVSKKVSVNTMGYVGVVC